jgi:hypothetical protein
VDYERAGGLVSELREPVVRAMAMEGEYEREDDAEDQAEEEAEKANPENLSKA